MQALRDVMPRKFWEVLVLTSIRNVTAIPLWKPHNSQNDGYFQF